MNSDNSRLGKPEKQKVISLFGGKSYFFRIPKYQRSYVWSDRGRSEQLIQFWDDFMDTEKSQDSLPFLGNLILSRTEENSVYDVVDGQQRLITIQLLFRALLNALIDVAGENQQAYKTNIDSLRQALVSYDEYGDQKMLKLTTGKDIQVYFEELVMSGKLAAQPIQKDKHWFVWNADRFFTEKIGSYIEAAKTAADKAKLLVQLFKRIGEVEFIIILLHDQSDAYDVFESFNAKGERLNTGDLFKNLLLSKLDDNEAKAFAQWEEIVLNVEVINRYLPQFSIDTFLRYYWSAEHGYVNPRSLYREIKNNTTNYQGLLDGLQKTSKQLSQLIDIGSLTPSVVSAIFPTDKDPGGKDSNKIVSSIKGLTSLRTQQYIVWVISILKNWKHINNRRHVANSLRSIESFSVLYFTGGIASANKVEKIFSSLSKELTNSVNNKSTKKDGIRSRETIILNGFNQYVEAQNLLPTKEEFLGATSSRLALDYRNKSFIWYLLEQIEKSRRKTSEFQIDRIVVNLEHLLPQKPDEGWNLEKDAIKGYVNLIGNLTLLDFEINGSIKNSVPKSKVRQSVDSPGKFLSDSELEITKEVVKIWESNGYVWNEGLIRKRQVALIEEIYDIFSK